MKSGFVCPSRRTLKIPSSFVATKNMTDITIYYLIRLNKFTSLRKFLYPAKYPICVSFRLDVDLCQCHFRSQL